MSRLRAAAVAALLVAGVLAAPAAAAAGPPPQVQVQVQVRQDLAAARAATAPLHRIDAATAADYAAFPEGVPLHECIADLHGHGAMGVHWVNGGLLDATVDPATPEVLVYEPMANGRMRLVAAEYVMFVSAWEEAHPGVVDPDPPRLFGMDMALVQSPNRYELPAFYARHAWVFSHNPMGMFADHNPMVTCEHWEG